MKLSSIFRFRLKTKILNIVLGLPFICIILFGAISYIAMINLGTYTTGAIETLGTDILDRSKNSMQNRAEKYLLWIASNQAAVSDAIFLRGMSEVDRMTALADYIWKNTSDIELKSFFSYEEKPKNIYVTSRYKLAPKVTLHDVGRELALSSGLDQIFMSLFANDEHLTSVFVGTESGIFRIYPWSDDLQPTYDPRKSGWYQRAAKTGKLGWTKPYVESGGKKQTITCSKPFYNSRGKLRGVIGADVMLSSLTEKIINTRVGDVGYVFLLDDKGNVIARPQITPDDSRWDESFAMENFLMCANLGLKATANDMTKGEKGVNLCDFDNVKKYIAFAPIPSMKWSVAVVIPLEEMIPLTLTDSRGDENLTRDINREIGEYTKQGQASFILVFLTIIIIIVFFGMRLSNKITDPILTLAQGAKVIGSGNLDNLLEIRTGDEIEELADALNKMASDLKTYIDELNKETISKERIQQTKIMITGIKEVLSGKYSFEGLLPFMSKESRREGDVLFKKGDQSDKLYYIKTGTILLLEINIRVGENNIIGEMGLFRASKERTVSAVCENDVELYSITHDKLFHLYNLDPSIGLYLIQLITHRLIENLKVEAKEKERIESELRIAHDIQTRSLPSVFPPFPDRKEFDIFAYLTPAKEIGGDLYDFFFIDENKLCFLIGDVSGKGVPAALFMMTTKTLLKAAVSGGLSLEDVLYNVNNILASENDTSMFITLFCAILNTDTGELEFINAGHNHPLVFRSGKDFEYITPKANFVLGPMEEMRFPSEYSVLKPGDTIFLYTDGVTEAQNLENKLYSKERLQKTLSQLRDKDVRGVLNGVKGDINRFVQNAPQYDDITMMALKFNG